MAAFAFTVILSMTVINSTGIMSPHPVPTNANISLDSTESVLNVSSGSTDAINNDIFGWAGILGFFGTIKSFLYSSQIIATYLGYMGAYPAAVAALAACIVVVLVLGIYQIMTRYGLGWQNL